MEKVVSTYQNTTAAWLGEHLWLSRDSETGLSDELVILATSKATNDTERYLNLYKIINQKIQPWHSEFLRLPLDSVNSLDFQMGFVQYIEDNELRQIVICNDAQRFNNKTLVCEDCQPYKSTLWLQQVDCMSCDDYLFLTYEKPITITDHLRGVDPLIDYVFRKHCVTAK